MGTSPESHRGRWPRGRWTARRGLGRIALTVALSSAALVLGACSTWNTRGVAELRPGTEVGRLLVVTATEALLLEGAKVGEREITGPKLRAWKVVRPVKVELKEEDVSPEALARRFGWEEQPAASLAGIAVVPRGDVQHLSRFDPRRGRMVALAIGVPFSAIAIFAALLPFMIACGRPLRVRGKRVITPTRRGSDWGEALPIQPVPDDVRKTLIDIWTQEAQAEHAAIAAFSELSLELLALGAPPDLVARANRAAIQEVEHARLCFALASAYRGEPLAPAPLPQALEGDTVCLDRLARESLLDGCIREGIASTIARLGAETARDPEVARVMRVQAKEEAQHAALGWAIVQWCIDVGGEDMRTLLLRTLARADLPRCDDLPEHGRIGRKAIKPHFDALCAEAESRLRSHGVRQAA